MNLGDFIDRLSPGDHISAEQWNLRGDLHRREQTGPIAIVDSLGTFHRRPDQRRHDVLMRNKTGATREPYEIVGIDDALHDRTYDAKTLLEFKYRVGLTGIVPAVPTHNSRFGVFQEQVKDTMIGLVKVAGETQVKVDIQNVTDKFCDVKDGVCTELISNSTGGATILWQPGTTGVQWCVIRIEGVSTGEIWYFTLAATLVQWTTPIVPVAAYRRVKNPAGNAGWGSLDIDCTQPLVVGDYALIGVYGKPGAQGWAEMWMTDNGRVGIIQGLNCPDACVCGTDYTETTPCV